MTEDAKPTGGSPPDGPPSLSGADVLGAVGEALEPTYTDLAGMLKALKDAEQAGQGGDISVQILDAKYREARAAGSDASDEEESLQDRIDNALDPAFDDRVAMRQLLEEADNTYFQHPMVSILRSKFAEAEALQKSPSGPARSIEPAASAGSESEEDSEEEDADEDDDFNVDAEIPTFNPAATLTGGANRRGSVVEFGGRRMSMSVGAELMATAARLKSAVATGDATHMQAALDAASAAATMDGPGAAEVQQLAMEIASRLATDEDLRRSATLRQSHSVRAKVRRLWDLMVVESAAIELEADPDAVATGYRMGAEGEPDGIRCAAAGPSSPVTVSSEGEVTKGGYKLLHMRVAKVLTAPDMYSFSEANDDAEAEWDADVTRFLGTSHIMVWLDTIRKQFHSASRKAVMEHGFHALFTQYDDDGNGELDIEEFAAAVRDDLRIGRDVLPDYELRKMFYAVDRDGGGTIDGQEFAQWLMAPTPEGNRMKVVKEQFRAAAEAKTETLGWQIIFDKYDDDGSGELDLEEFAHCVRKECGLDKETTTDEDVKELFGIVDTDQSGAIDAEELRTFLTTNLEAASMSFTPFLASIFELTALWVPTESEKQYSRFLDVMFQRICCPCNGHTQDEWSTMEKVPVIEPRVVDSRGNMVPNFRLRPLDEVESMILGDGTLDGFSAHSIEGLEAAERARAQAEERRKARRQEQEKKRLAEEPRQRPKREPKPGRKVPVDGLELVMGFRWHDGFRWHEGAQNPEETKRKKIRKTAKKRQHEQQKVFNLTLDSSVAAPGGPERSTAPLRYDPATHTIRQTPRQVLPKLKDPAEMAQVPKPTVMMNKGNVEITDRKGALRARQADAVHRPAATNATEVGAAGCAATAAATLSCARQHDRIQPMVQSPQSPKTSPKRLVKHAPVPVLPSSPSPSRLEGWTADVFEDNDEQPRSIPARTKTVGPAIPRPPRSPRHTSSGQRRTDYRSQQLRTTRTGTTAMLKAPSSSQAINFIATYRRCDPGTVSSTTREVAAPPGLSQSQRVPAHAALARTRNRAWSPRQMSARTRGFLTPPPKATRTGLAYVQTVSPSQRTSAHVSARMVGGVELLQRASTAREQVRPIRHHGASSIMAARPSTAGQVF